MASTRSRTAALLDGAAPPSLRVAPSSRANSWEDIADLVAMLGMPLDEWQEVALEAAMGERTNGLWSSKYIGISAPRQNGKSQLIVARALAGLLLFGEKMIILSAHETDTAREIWKRLIDVVEDNPSLEKRVTGRMNAINREYLEFGTGLDKQTIKLKARRQAGSRGFSADCLLLDEAQILGKTAWGSINPTMSARPNPQLWLFGTPPTEDDDAYAFARVRDSSLHKKARHTWLEWSAAPTDDFDDPATWAKSNPSYGVRISEEACADDRAAMDDDQFALERLGIWIDPSELRATAFGPGIWESRGPEVDKRGQIKKPVEPVIDAIGISVAWGGGSASIGAAGLKDGVAVVGAIDQRDGVGWVVAEAKRIQSERGCLVAIDSHGPAADLIPALVAAGLEVDVTLIVLKTENVKDACAQIHTRVVEGRLIHPAHPFLDAAVAAARKRDVGDSGRWMWGRKISTGNIAMLESVTNALWVASNAEPVEAPREFWGAVG